MDSKRLLFIPTFNDLRNDKGKLIIIGTVKWDKGRIFYLVKLLEKFDRETRNWEMITKLKR